MAFDAAFLRACVLELNKNVIGLKVDKIQQPESDCVIITLRGAGGAKRILISADASGARVHLTNDRRENPKVAPMFCMLMRKHLTGGKLVGIDQPGFERVCDISFEVYNEFGELTKKHLAVEIMGRYSNLVLYEEGGRIIDAVRHVDLTMSRQRQVLPGLKYERPPAQGKVNPLTAERAEAEELLSSRCDRRCDKFLLDTFEGLSPLICREIAFRAAASDKMMSELDGGTRDKLIFQFVRMVELIKLYDFTPTLLSDPASGRPKEFTFTSVHQYGMEMSESSCAGFGELLDAFYQKRDRMERIRRRSHDILRVVVNAVERVSRKISIQRAELDSVADRDRLRLCADLIMSNLYRIEEGMDSVTVENYFEEGSPQITVKLDPFTSPTDNAQRYYKEYARAKVKESHLSQQLEASVAELEYLESVFDNLSKAETENELTELRDELISGGYISPAKGQKGQKKTPPSSPMRFESDDGFTIMVGKNNIQNDRLTLKTAGRFDIWFHVKNIPGSHTILFTDGAEPSELAMTQAATLAATYSKARDSKNVPVDFTQVRNVKKPSGARPGMVIYEKNRTAYVDPNEALAERLRKG